MVIAVSVQTGVHTDAPLSLSSLCYGFWSVKEPVESRLQSGSVAVVFSRIAACRRRIWSTASRHGRKPGDMLQLGSVFLRLYVTWSSSSGVIISSSLIWVSSCPPAYLRAVGGPIVEARSVLQFNSCKTHKLITCSCTAHLTHKKNILSRPIGL